MPSFQPYIQRAGDKPTTITAPDLGSGRGVEQSVAPVNKDVQMRRQQRWVFYAIFVLLFLAALILVLKVYADNTKLVANVENLNATISQRNSDLEKVRQDLADRNQAAEAASTSLEQLKQELAKNVSQLQEITAKNKEFETQVSEKGTEVDNSKLVLERAKANTLNLILTLGVELKADDIKKIPVADVIIAGTDTDKDGLSDDFETALGSDPLKTDTDGDSYGDKEEVVGGFNYLGQGMMPLDIKFAEKYKGKIVLNRRGEVFYAWYIGQDAKRYYMGSSENKFEALRENDYWSTPKK
jgi:cell division protein FtsL